MERRDGIHNCYLKRAALLEGASERNLEKEVRETWAEPTLSAYMSRAKSLLGTLHRLCCPGFLRTWQSG